LSPPAFEAAAAYNQLRYNIFAKFRRKPPWHARRMLQTLLLERFQLAQHEDHKELQVYLLTAAKKGLKRPQQGPGPLPLRANLPVVDATETAGAFDFQLDWAPRVNNSTPTAQPAVPGDHAANETSDGQLRRGQGPGARGQGLLARWRSLFALCALAARLRTAVERTQQNPGPWPPAPAS
jgi:hypothetical protein